MRGANVVFQAVLMFAIVVAGALVVLPWAMKTVQRSSETSEPSIILNELRDCSKKITETARTGSGNTCSFSIVAGSLDIKQEGIYYTLESTSKNICDQHLEFEVDPENHIYQSCTAYSNFRKLQYRWSWPSQITIGGSGFGGSITFDPSINFTTLTVYVAFESIPGGEGGHA